LPRGKGREQLGKRFAVVVPSPMHSSPGQWSSSAPCRRVLDLHRSDQKSRFAGPQPGF
jgi:hypothetical protein